MYYNFAVQIPSEKGKILTKAKADLPMYSSSTGRIISLIRSMPYPKGRSSEGLILLIQQRCFLTKNFSSTFLKRCFPKNCLRRTGVAVSE